MIRELVGLLYPSICIGCNGPLLTGEPYLCTDCLYHLPQTNFHTQAGNPLERTFWGRIPVVRAYSFLYFKKEGIAQKVLHHLKYKGDKELAEFMGVLYGTRLAELPEKADGILAVPLHLAKLRKRGYNQSEWFAKGLARSTGIEDLSAEVYRKRATETQTKKSRFERWTNVREVFALREASRLENRHVLICDDVITTGATIEALAGILPASCKVSVCSIAMPVR